MTIGTRLVLAALAAPLGALLLTPAAQASDNTTPDAPFTVTVTKPSCGSRTVEIKLRSTSDYDTSFSITRDDDTVDSGTLQARRNYSKRIKLGSERSIEIETFYTTQDSRNKLVSRDQVTNDCRWRHRRDWDDDRDWRDRDRDWDDDDYLPYTGPPADLMGKLATAGGLVLTGGIVWWYGSIWPRQTYRRPDSDTKA